MQCKNGLRLFSRKRDFTTSGNRDFREKGKSMFDINAFLGNRDIQGMGIRPSLSTNFMTELSQSSNIFLLIPEHNTVVIRLMLFKSQMPTRCQVNKRMTGRCGKEDEDCHYYFSITRRDKLIYQRLL
uniref:Uncharacterized protein n=1 Tax=Romanomermis culicivorax TaxID=13658 RepID=A0A915KE41_ROMCU